MFRTEYSTWEPQWSETEHEVFRDFGFAAFTAQMLDSALITILLAAEHAGHLTFNKKNDIESELFLSRQTLGALITELKRLGLDDETADMLKDALEARNFLMHHFFVWHARDSPIATFEPLCSSKIRNLLLISLCLSGCGDALD